MKKLKRIAMCENEEVRQFSRIHYDAKVAFQETVLENESLKSRLSIAELTLSSGQTQAASSIERDSIFREEIALSKARELSLQT